MLWKATWVQCCGLNFCQPIQVPSQNVALEDQVGELPLANNLDQAGRGQLFYVMGKGGGAHAMGLMQLGAGRRVATCPDFLKNLVSSWFGQSSGYPRKLPVCEAASLGDCHPLQGTPDRNQMSISRGRV